MDKYFHPLYGITEPSAEPGIRRKFNAKLARGHRLRISMHAAGLAFGIGYIASRLLGLSDIYYYALCFTLILLALALVSTFYRNRDRAVMQAILMKARRCTYCGYDLSAYQTVVCPECGTRAEVTGPGPESMIRISLLNEDGKDYIRIDIADIALLRALQRVFFDLTQSRIATQSLADLERVEFIGFTDLILANGPGKLSPFRLNRIDIDKSQPGIYSWTESPDTWFDCVSRIQTLIEEKSPGRQYLIEDTEPISNVLLSFGEQQE